MYRGSCNTEINCHHRSRTYAVILCTHVSLKSQSLAGLIFVSVACVVLLLILIIVVVYTRKELRKAIDVMYAKVCKKKTLSNQSVDYDSRDDINLIEENWSTAWCVCAAMVSFILYSMKLNFKNYEAIKMLIARVNCGLFSARDSRRAGLLGNMVKRREWVVEHQNKWDRLRRQYEVSVVWLWAHCA